MEFVHYTSLQTKTWQVTASRRPRRPGGQVAARQTFTEAPGWWYWPFPVHRAYQDLRKVCLTATDAFGTSCISFPQPPS